MTALTKGLGITHPTWDSVRDSIRANMGATIPTQVITLTPEMCARSHSDEKFRIMIDNADIVVADGIGVVWGEGRLTGKKPEKIPGIELALWSLEEAYRISGKVYLLGSKAEIVKKAAERVAFQYPRLSVSGFHDGYFSPDEEQSIVDEIALIEPNLLLVGMGSPLQEEFISRNLRKMRCGVAIGVGGTFDVLSGSVKRAPGFFRATGTEWLYRTLSQPGSRLKRLPKLAEFVGIVLRRSGNNSILK